MMFEIYRNLYLLAEYYSIVILDRMFNHKQHGAQSSEGNVPLILIQQVRKYQLIFSEVQLLILLVKVTAVG